MIRRRKKIGEFFMTTMFILNQNDLAKSVREEYGCTGKDCKAIVTDIFEEISQSLSEGKDVSINGFGKFEVRERAARKGINPATKEEIDIPATKTVGFKPSKTLKDTLK
jgi:Bacterial nucleoid DNA-binding protein